MLEGKPGRSQGVLTRPLPLGQVEALLAQAKARHGKLP